MFDPEVVPTSLGDTIDVSNSQVHLIGSRREVIGHINPVLFVSPPSPPRNKASPGAKIDQPVELTRPVIATIARRYSVETNSNFLRTRTRTLAPLHQRQKRPSRLHLSLPIVGRYLARSSIDSPCKERLIEMRRCTGGVKRDWIELGLVDRSSFSACLSLMYSPST